MPYPYARPLRDTCYVRLIRIKDDDSDIAYEIRTNDEPPTIPPYVPCSVVTPSDYWKIGDKVSLTNVSSYCFGQDLPSSEWKECFVYMKRLPDDANSRLVFGIYVGDNGSLQRLFYPLHHKIGEEVTVAVVHKDDLTERKR